MHPAKRSRRSSVLTLENYLQRTRCWTCEERFWRIWHCNNYPLLLLAPSPLQKKKIGAPFRYCGRCCRCCYYGSSTLPPGDMILVDCCCCCCSGALWIEDFEGYGWIFHVSITGGENNNTRTIERHTAIWRKCFPFLVIFALELDTAVSFLHLVWWWGRWGWGAGVGNDLPECNLLQFHSHDPSWLPVFFSCQDRSSHPIFSCQLLRTHLDACGYWLNCLISTRD